MEKKRMVIIQHLSGSPQFYLFLVPPGAYSMCAGKLVRCQTKRGEQLGICACDPFEADPETVCPMFNTVPGNMKHVISEFTEHRFTIPEEDENEDGQPNGGRTV